MIFLPVEVEEKTLSEHWRFQTQPRRLLFNLSKIHRPRRDAHHHFPQTFFTGKPHII